MSQAGIGTYSIPEMATPMMAKVSKTVDMMIGNHLNAHVMGQYFIHLLLPYSVANIKIGGYEFLMQNCKSERAPRVMPLILTFVDDAGDKICIFGFSRGAYTARALAGM
jgi:hypothetical protein